jgi:hypothetical protein
MSNTLQAFPEQINSWWITLLLLIVIAALAWIRVNYARRFVQLFNATVNLRMLHQLMRQELVLSHRASIALSVIFILNLSTFAYLCDRVFALEIFEGSGFLIWAKYLSFFTLIYLVKLLFIELVRTWFDGDFGLSEYRYNIFLTGKVSGLILLPFIALAAYNAIGYRKEVLIAAGVILLLLLIYRWFRGIRNAIQLRISPFYIILYFCTLEILPLVLLLKVLSL